MRSKKAIKNIIASLLQQFITIICGFILPRAIIGKYGSDVNGLISSITQFLAYITLLEAGIGPVIKATLYKPIANKDNEQIEKILKSTQRFFNIIGYIFIIYLIILCFVYPMFVNNEFDNWYTISLILIISISTFAEYFVGMVYKLYLQADQKTYITANIQTVTTVLNTIFCVILIKIGANIQAVKLVSAFIFVLRPICQNIYVKKKYNINLNNVKEEYELKEKWDGLSQHIASVIHNNTDVTILTIFCDIAEVSVYSVYYLIAGRLTTLVQTVTNGMDAAFGNVLAKRETQVLQENFRIYEQLLYTVSTFAFGCAMFLIEPFVMVYTAGVTDVDYSRIVFGMLMCFNQFLFCVRLPYQMITYAAGHFKQTRNGAIFEAVMNVTVSIALVIRFGLIGVTIGTFCAYCFRTFQYAIYSSKNLLQRSIWVMLKLLIASILELLLSFALIQLLTKIPYFKIINSYGKWAIYAICVAMIIGTIIFLFSFLVFNKQTKMMVKKLVFAVKK